MGPRISLAGLAEICKASRPHSPTGGDMKLFRRSYHFSSGVRFLAAMLLLLASTGGCAFWDRDRWNLDRYRDERAVDIDQRLDQAEPIVKNPF